MANTSKRNEKDSFGSIQVPEDVLWGAQTQRSFENFKISSHTMPFEIIRAIVIIKKACAKVNFLSSKNTGDKKKGKAIISACDKILSDENIIKNNFPLSVFQTGSGTQTNMNVNEVISNIASSQIPIHPNDDVNKSQSTNDVFPTAINVATVLLINEKLLPALDDLISTFKTLEKENKDIIKSGRTHLQDATPVKFSQEISAWRYSIETCKKQILMSLTGIKDLAIGGTAVGTGINTKTNFSKDVVNEISKITGVTFKPSKNKFHALSSKDTVVFCHGALKSLSCDLIKIANDIRFLACGPRTGIGEIEIPSNEPGSSIMPGKVNPTQCEAIIMACMQVIGNDNAVSNAAMAGMLELNVCMPLIAYDMIDSITLLSDSINSFNKKCVKGIKANKEKMKENLEKSLMNATILNTVIGYDNVAKVVKLAHKDNLTLKEACIKLKYLSEEEFDKYYKIDKMV